MYYYGARYYDPRISIFVSVDPLAEKTMTPYQYVNNNPIMFTDPTGMSAEGAGDPLKNVVINFLRNEKDKHGNTLGNYDNKGLAENGWHVIDVTSIEEANTKLTEYLGGSKADNIFINAHGGRLYESGGFSSDGNEIKNYNDSFINFEGNSLLGSQVLDYANGNRSGIPQEAASKIESLMSIGSQIKDNKNLIIASCYTGTGDKFGEGISKLVPNVDVFLNKDYTTSNSDGRTGKIDYIGFSRPLTTNKNYENGWIRYNTGSKRREKFNVQINKTNGVSAF